MTGGAQGPGGRTVLVVTGQSGAGKGTLIARLRERIPELELAVSATTRSARTGEEHGRDYWFLAEEEFDRLLASGAFLEHVVFPWGQRSGTLRPELDRIADAGRVCLLELEVEGALAVQETVPGSVTIFVTAPIPELERRLRARATESEAEIEERIALARRQLEVVDTFDHVIENDDLDRATDALVAVVRPLAAAAARVGGDDPSPH
ncbi:MAG: guanylate kinase [Actinobacteria bacterium]|nr:guanylate kinase [Actinomycetota bacterium]